MDLANKILLEKSDDKKWEMVQEMFSILYNSENKIKLTNKFRLCQSIYNYAIYLLYEDKIEKSKEIFDFIYQNNLTESAATNQVIFYFNYSTLFLKIGETQKAIEMHTYVMNSFQGIHESKLTLFIIRNIYLNLLNNKFENVFQDISEITPRLFKEDQQLYVRALLIIYLIETQDIESACRECENARKTSMFNSELAAEESMIIQFIHSLILLQIKEKISLTKFNKVEVNITTSDLWKSSNHLLKIWLKKYLERVGQIVKT